MATKKTDKKRLVLLDSHAILHRAYHALPDFTSSTGEPTGALYGLAAMLLKIIDELKPDYVIAAYDLPEPTHRHVAYEAYKATRMKADPELVAQMIRSRDIFDAFSIPRYECPGFEADDVLGTIVEETKKRDDLEIIIASGDMDTLQLVDDARVRVYTLRKGIKDTIMYDEKGVVARYGFVPELLPDFKGLRGDPSDNIIGVKGIGEKTATELIKEFGTIEKMYKALKKTPDRFDSAGIKERMKKLLEENEEEALFSKELATIRRDAPIEFSLPETSWSEALEVEKVYALFSELGFRTLAARVKQVYGTDDAAGEDSAPQEKQEDISEQEIKEITVAFWLLDSDVTNPSLEDVFARTRTNRFAEAREKIFAELAEKGLDRVYEEIEKPLMPVIERMQKHGVLLDVKFLEKLSHEYHKDLAKIEEKIWKHAGVQFNINSPKQLGEVLFDKLNITAKNLKRTAGGARSTRESELEKMKDEHEIIAEILAYRELQKLLSTYIDPLPRMADSEGRLHTTFMQTGATTGRMSSQNPNLQNIPIRTEHGRRIRNAFIAAPGHTLVSLDYSQIELRIAAVLSGDKKLVEIFKSGEDVHKATAAEVFGVAPENVDPEMRRRAKVINFGILYGMGVNALRVQLGTSRTEAQDFLNAYFERFRGLAQYIDATKQEAYRLGYTETLCGRRRHFEGMRSSLPQVKAAAERMAINAPIQGTQADLIKIAMAKVDDWLHGNGHRDGAHLILQVHDELVYEIKGEIKEGAPGSIVPEIIRIMESVFTLQQTHGVPIRADAKAGKNWGEMKPISL